MKNTFCVLVVFTVGNVFVPAVAMAAKAVADVIPPQRREPALAAAKRISDRIAPAPLPVELASPFSPQGFEGPDPASIRPAAQKPGGSGSAASTAPSVPASDREILETLAARLNPSGTLMRAGKPLLIIDRNRFEVGTKFVVTYNDFDYELQLVSIERTTFTLRFRGEEITRPIKPAR